MAVIILLFLWFLAYPGVTLAETPPNDLLMQQVIRHLDQENYEEALALLHQSWQKGPRTAEKAFLLGKVNRSLLR